MERIKNKLIEENIILFFQPIVDKNFEIKKYEALVRLKDGDMFFSPIDFLSLIKKSNYHIEMSKIILKKIIDTILNENIEITFNITNYDLSNDEFISFFYSQLNRLNNKSKLTLELIETENITHEKNISVLKDFQNLGVKIYLDDFGTGYSNLDFLLRLRPDGIKIDGEFIKNILENKDSQIIVKHICNFAKDFNLKIVAEFIEDEEIFNFLNKNYLIDYFQGYFFGKPCKEVKRKIVC